MFHERLRRKCILLFLDGMSYKYQLSPFGLMSFKACVSLLIFCLDDLCIDISPVLKFPVIIVLCSVSPFMLVNICFMYLDAPMLGAYIFTIVLLVGSIPLSLYNVLFCLLLQSLF